MPRNGERFALGVDTPRSLPEGIAGEGAGEDPTWEPSADEWRHRARGHGAVGCPFPVRTVSTKPALSHPAAPGAPLGRDPVNRGPGTASRGTGWERDRRTPREGFGEEGNLESLERYSVEMGTEYPSEETLWGKEWGALRKGPCGEEPGGEGTSQSFRLLAGRSDGTAMTGSGRRAAGDTAAQAGQEQCESAAGAAQERDRSAAGVRRERGRSRVGAG